MDVDDDNQSDSSEPALHIIDRQRIRDINEILEPLDEFWKQFGRYFLENNLKLECLEQTAALINEFPGNKFIIPTTKYLILQKFGKDRFPLHFWIYCKNCDKHKSSPSERNKFNCSTCNSVLYTEHDQFFVIINTSAQLKRIIEVNWDSIVEYQNRKRDDKNINDISDGYILSSLNQQNPLDIKLSLLMNTDGVQVFKSSTESLWPIQLICNFLPPNLRFNKNNIIVCGLYLGKGKPDIMSFLHLSLKSSIK